MSYSIKKGLIRKLWWNLVKKAHLRCHPGGVAGVDHRCGSAGRNTKPAARAVPVWCGGFGASLGTRKTPLASCSRHHSATHWQQNVCTQNQYWLVLCNSDNKRTKSKVKAVEISFQNNKDELTNNWVGKLKIKTIKTSNWFKVQIMIKLWMENSNFCPLALQFKWFSSKLDGSLLHHMKYPKVVTD